MREVIFLRHGLTDWNREHRIQGQTDAPLCAAGIAQVRAWRLPERYRDIAWYTSSLGRALDTARALGIEPMGTSDALMEMHWGEWTGRRIAELRESLGETMAANERRGLDFQPPGGESPRRVRARLAAWLHALPPGTDPVGVVTHKGVIRAAVSLATGWDLKADHAEKLERDAMHRFLLDGGMLVSVELNIAL